MGTISEEITRLNNAKTAIKTAVNNITLYSGTIPESAKLDEYADYIEDKFSFDKFNTNNLGSSDITPTDSKLYVKVSSQYVLDGELDIGFRESSSAAWTVTEKSIQIQESGDFIIFEIPVNSTYTGEIYFTFSLTSERGEVLVDLQTTNSTGSSSGTYGFSTGLADGETVYYWVKKQAAIRNLIN